MNVLRNPDRKQFADAIRQLAGVYGIGQEWIDRAYDAAHIWVRAEFATSSYGPNNQRLIVNCRWENGEHIVTIYRAS